MHWKAENVQSNTTEKSNLCCVYIVHSALCKSSPSMTKAKSEQYYPANLPSNPVAMNVWEQ